MTVMKSFRTGVAGDEPLCVSNVEDGLSNSFETGRTI